MTVIVIPNTGKRTLTFRFSPAWFGLIGVVVLTIAGLSLSLAAQQRTNKALKAELAQVDSLKRTNRVQTAEIAELSDKISVTDAKLAELQALEAQLRELSGQTAPSRSGAALPVEYVHNGGRGGPQGTSLSLEGLPTLSGMLPPEVGAYLFGKRDTLLMDLRRPEAQKVDSGDPQRDADALNQHVDDQTISMERLVAQMTASKQTILEQQDYVAHRPSGLPVTGMFTDRFGGRWSPFGLGYQFHEGLDIATSSGRAIVATGAGVIIQSGWKAGGYGNAVMIDHGYGFVTLYAHMSDVKYPVGTEVRRGDVIGWVGSTGDSTGPHCHYEVHVNGVPVDPVKFMQ
jgi:murein DD-endopeptidase MepM/ murein hydrolase activator NlpD